MLSAAVEAGIPIYTGAELEFQDDELRDEVAAEEPISSEGATHQLVTPKSSEAGE